MNSHLTLTPLKNHRCQRLIISVQSLNLLPLDLLELLYEKETQLDWLDLADYVL